MLFKYEMSCSKYRNVILIVRQDEADEASIEKLHEMDTETTRLRNETVAFKTEEKELRSALRDGASRIPLPELQASVTALEQQKAELVSRLEKLKGGDSKPVSPEERDKVKSDHRKWHKTANNRKKIRSELWKEVTQIIDKDKWEETKEDLGLEF